MAGERALASALLIASAVACTPDPPPAPPTATDPLAHLRAFERARRAEAHFLEAPPSDRALGADPYDLAALPDGRVAGILRGRDALVLLDASLEEKARVPLPRSPSAIAVYGGRDRGPFRRGDVLVASDVVPVLAHVRGEERLADIPLEGVVGARDLVVGEDGVIHVVEEHDDRLISLRIRADGTLDRHERAVPRGPIRLARTRDALYVASVTGHAVTVLPLDREGIPGAPSATATIDGPFWAIDAIDTDAGALVVATGVEDHPLDRREGFFGWVDSFVYVWMHAPGSRELARVAALNASELGAVVPKAVLLEGAPLRATIAAYGSPNELRLSWPLGPRAAPAVTAAPALPGTSALVATRAGIVAANPLIDAWVSTGHIAYPADAADRRGDATRLGEALFFTELMAPGHRSEGALSRFTCETCHFEGYVDGRTHHTGRGDVHATTKPLLGLFANRPHFSRALDPDLSAVAENEFRVAGAPSPNDPHFSVDAASVPWLRALRLERASFGPDDLRTALMDFLMTWTHRTNPTATTHRSFTALERAGAVAFRDRCERCHQARAAADQPASRVAFDRWESLVLSDGGPLVWASDAYEKTGVVPYVHELGARVPSLRRLYKKKPYFTSGSAADVRAVLERARFGPDRFAHAGSTEGEALDAATVRALEAFLDLL